MQTGVHPPQIGRKARPQAIGRAAVQAGELATGSPRLNHRPHRYSSARLSCTIKRAPSRASGQRLSTIYGTSR
jgi:hypothetical protein